jgi:4-hydroxy-3-methylbut-2-enyl diphosphate reductase
MKKFEIPEQYKSTIIGSLKAWRKSKDPRKQDFEPTTIDFGPVSLILPRHFGFCYGVENAIEISYKAISENPGKRILLLSQMIHNPAVNEDLERRGIQFIMDTEGHQFIPWDAITSDDIVVIPAFGTTVEIEQLLASKGIETKKYLWRRFGSAVRRLVSRVSQISFMANTSMKKHERHSHIAHKIHLVSLYVI